MHGRLSQYIIAWSVAAWEGGLTSGGVTNEVHARKIWMDVKAPEGRTKNAGERITLH